MLGGTIREVVHYKPDRLPRLEKVCFRATWGIEGRCKVTDKLPKLCEDAGFQLGFLKEWDGKGFPWKGKCYRGAGFIDGASTSDQAVIAA